ncbi:conserved hypothetical protein [Ricinus communis]|uniref:Uncharacterized protein n=1 Tax=Ricinus communis TaxID=3988 RepID=B9TF17_RICCO|nr:conserved hypothetical protein [Ricinus communis]
MLWKAFPANSQKKPTAPYQYRVLKTRLNTFPVGNEKSPTTMWAPGRPRRIRCASTRSIMSCSNTFRKKFATTMSYCSNSSTSMMSLCTWRMRTSTMPSRSRLAWNFFSMVADRSTTVTSAPSRAAWTASRPWPTPANSTLSPGRSLSSMATLQRWIDLPL